MLPARAVAGGRVHHHARWFYVYNLLLPSVLFTVLGLLACFLSPESGERLGFGVTLLLAREFGKALVMSHTPICDETLWMNYFDVLNEAFTILPILETAVVVFFYYREDNLEPIMLKLLRRRILGKGPEKMLEDTRESASAKLCNAPLAPASADAAAAEQSTRLISYERLFFALDLATADGRFVGYAEVDRFLSFVAFELTAAERARLIVESQDERLASLSEAHEFYRENLMRITRAHPVGDRTARRPLTTTAAANLAHHHCCRSGSHHHCCRSG